MAGSMATMMASLKLDIQDFSSKLKQASTKMSDFAATTNRDYGRATAALKSHNLGLKDTARIVQGIVISQTFYAGVQAISSATSALWNFNVALDYMRVTYSALFGDTKIASDFMSALQEHSIETIFDYQGLADASKKLLAYGIEYENLMFIMEGLTNLGTMSGDSAALDRIALALGQIYTKGKLSAEEMRQLANAYIPITEILQDKFGLTGDDLKRVGDLNLPANEVINAIVDYANENFGSVGDAAMYTITGLQNRIVDTLKVVGSQMLTPITTAYKSFLVYVSKGLEAIRTEFEAGGIGGVFEYLVPDPAVQGIIRQFIANIRNLFMSIISVGVAAGQVFGNFATVFVTAFNIVSPVIIGFVNLLAGVLNAMLETRVGATLLRIALVAAAGAFVVLRIQAAAALVVTAVTKAINGLSKALLLLSAIISKHPILSILAGLAIAAIGVASASKNANSALSGLFDTISGATGGASSDDVLQRTEGQLEDSADAADQFNERLEEGAGNAEDLEKAMGGAGGAADKAAKKVAGLLSFDEVFKLPEPKDPSGGSGGGAGSSIMDDIANLGAGLGSLGDSLIPKIPDFSEFIKGFNDSLFGGLERGILDAIASTSLGALIGGGIGAIIGGLLGGAPGAILGAKIGAFAGGLVGLLWELLDGAINNTVTGAISGIAGAISKAFMIAFSSSALAGLKGGSFKAFFGSIGSLFKLTGLKEIAKGGIIGAAIGIVVDTLAHFLWGSLEDKFENADAETAKVGQTIGGVIGTIIGALLGGPPGAIIGSAIGTFAGGFVGLFWAPIKEYFDPRNNALSAFFVSVGRDIGVWATDTVKSLSGWWNDTSTGFSNWWSETSNGFSTWWDDTETGLSSWFDNTIATFTDWESINGETLGNWWNETISGFATWKYDTENKVSAWRTATGTKLSTWFSETFAGFSKWYYDTSATVSSWGSTLRETISNWVTNTVARFTEWVANVKAKFTEWKDKVVAVVTGFDIAAGEALRTAMINLRNAVTTKLDEISTKWTEKWDGIKTRFGTWWAGMKISMDAWLTDYIWKPISNFFNLDNFWNRIKSLLDAIKRKFKNWWKEIGKIFGDDNSPDPDSPTPYNSTPRSPTTPSGARPAGFYRGGIVDRDQIARVAEYNRREAIIPLENPGAMQPFADAVSGGIISSLAPLVANINGGGQNTLPPLYVGALIADDRGIEQLYKKFEVIQLRENSRRGLAGT